MKALLTTVLVLTGVSCLIATTSLAATLHVAQDGSGDFTVIQDAVDAANPGDVIHIHAGRYEEMTEDYDVWGNGYFIADVHVIIETDNLTLQGDGPDVTIIGPLTEPSDPLEAHVAITASQYGVSTLTVRDLMMEHVRDGIVAASGSLGVYGCRVEDTNHNGIRTYTPDGAVVDGCEFVNASAAVFTSLGSANIQITNSRFEDCGRGGGFLFQRPTSWFKHASLSVVSSVSIFSKGQPVSFKIAR